MNKSKFDTIRTLIVGAGKAGELIAANILAEEGTSIEVVGFIDDNLELRDKKKNGVSILGTISDLSDIVKKEKINEIIIALPSERGEVVRRVINNTEGRKLNYKILPRDAEVLHQHFDKDYLKHIRKVKPEDLLGGVINKSDQDILASNLKNEVCMITGAAGSIGSELSRQLAVLGSKKIVFFDWWENGMFELRNEILEINPEGNYEFIIGDIKDVARVGSVIKEHKPTTIFHAAAYKHVPLMESNSIEAIKNNIIGTVNVATSAIESKVKKFVLVSTDKAVNPTNIMGATKRAAEKIINYLGENNRSTVFCSVRFGNVVNSNGSAIPFFQKQIEKGGPVTVTHINVTRFFMTIPEACNLILKAWHIGEHNDLFVLDMGESIKIYELAKTLIILNGYTPEDEMKIKIIGLRPGEKLYEEVLVGEEKLNSTEIDKIYKTQNYMDVDIKKLRSLFNELDLAIRETNETKCVDLLKKIVPTFNRTKF